MLLRHRTAESYCTYNNIIVYTVGIVIHVYSNFRFEYLCETEPYLKIMKIMGVSIVKIMGRD